MAAGLALGSPCGEADGRGWVLLVLALPKLLWSFRPCTLGVGGGWGEEKAHASSNSGVP